MGLNGQSQFILTHMHCKPYHWGLTATQRYILTSLPFSPTIKETSIIGLCTARLESNHKEVGSTATLCPA